MINTSLVRILVWSGFKKIEEPDDIKDFAENLVEEIRQNYGEEEGWEEGEKDERLKFHYALIFNSMTIAWKE